ncbi:hypothetical protein [Aequorivita lipolytica]|uniref:DUF4402 domain-containing protein n=1 Tax=Aequorivita lipolytica TaxID=153267 RepID=A0A5C6YN70_9FLAO|nr:hypothetical protein [Aequorivita lipolytica]TXD69022.1 hypothetical protein ESV24_09755 [Aequorivita lipolytica]
MKNFLRLKKMFLVISVLLFSNLANSSTHPSNILEFNTISNSENSDITPGCGTFTIGVNVGIFYIETQVEVCCHIFTPMPLCSYAQNGVNRNPEDLTIHVDLSNLDIGNTDMGETAPNNYIDVVSSTVEVFNGHNLRIKSKRYYINGDNTVNFEYEEI